jgi:Fe-S oxidoreductase
MLRETLGHTRMLKWSVVGAAHWFVFVGFGALGGTLVQAYGELLVDGWRLPVLGRWAAYGILVELVALSTLLGVLVLIATRLRQRPARLGRRSRFAGSTMWQGYYVEWTIVTIAVCVLVLRALEAVHDGATGWDAAHPVSGLLVPALDGLAAGTVRDLVLAVATVKIVASMLWFVVIALNTTMGVAWHRFTAFPNIWLKREPVTTREEGTSSVALGPLQPMRSGGREIDFEDPGEDDVFGVGKVEDLTWKGLLDVSTCTECGRCQSQCPAWHTEKPLSPKLVVTALRDHAHAKAPYLLAGEDPAAQAAVPAQARAEAERPLVAPEADGGVIDPDVLWSCTSCGACVEQCPVDIEHVDHIVDMRRYQVLIESAFPTELGGLFKNLERSGNPWGAPAAGRMDWAKGLDFEVPVVGETTESLEDYDYLFWVGCAGAFEDRAKRTTRAVAELLHTAGVRFAVLGSGEGCTGDPARRSGNEFLFQMLAAANVETLDAAGAGKGTGTKIVVTCPHCFTTIGREYPQLGGHYAVVHHTQLLNQLVRERRLVPVQRVEESVTYHDPCFLGRHNQVYSPPREVLGAVPGLELTEMQRTKERSFCCGAGGGRMWMEESIGRRINLDRVDEALSLAPDTVAVACPFCRVMVSDGVGAREGDAEVLDVAQVLLRSVRPAADPVAVAAGHPDAVDAASAGAEGGREG